MPEFMVPDEVPVPEAVPALTVQLDSPFQAMPKWIANALSPTLRANGTEVWHLFCSMASGSSPMQF